MGLFILYVAVRSVGREDAVLDALATLDLPLRLQTTDWSFTAIRAAIEERDRKKDRPGTSWPLATVESIDATVEELAAAALAPAFGAWVHDSEYGYLSAAGADAKLIRARSPLFHDGEDGWEQVFDHVRQTYSNEEWEPAAAEAFARWGEEIGRQGTDASSLQRVFSDESQFQAEAGIAAFHKLLGLPDFFQLALRWHS